VKSYSLGHLSDAVLHRNTRQLAARERDVSADLLAHIAEVDFRKAYVPEAYDSISAYCVGELRLSEDAAAKRIQVARAGRRCPAIFPTLAEGRVHLSGLVLLAPHLTPDNASELLAAATHKRKAEIERIVAERFPRLPIPTLVTPNPPDPAASASGEHAPGHAGSHEMTGSSAGEHAPGHVHEHARVTPVAPQKFALQLTMAEATHDKLRYAQELLGHQVPDGDIPTVLDRALDALIARLERTRFAITDQPRRCGATPAPGSRYVAADVKRAVVRRDECRCTFVSDSGRRCEARKRLEFDHEVPVARGGESTIANVRLRCRAHNQYGAERSFGVEFMRRKREESAERRNGPKARAAATKAKAIADSRQDADVEDDDAFRCLLALGYRATEARWALARCGEMPGATDEQRVKRALAQFPQRVTRVDRSDWLPVQHAEGGTNPAGEMNPHIGLSADATPAVATAG
jgi:hypothetical protein